MFKLKNDARSEGLPKRRPQLLIALLFLLAIFLTSWIWGAGKHDRYAQIAISQFPGSLLPPSSTTRSTLSIVRQLGEGLVREHPEREIALALAKSIHISDDGLTWDIRLKETKWSDGSALTVHDFKRVIVDTLTHRIITSNAPLLFPIRNARAIYQEGLSPDSLGIEITDDTTMKIYLESETPNFLYLLSTPSFYPLPPHYDLLLPGYISCGPFVLEQHLEDDRIVLRKNPHYWDSSTVKLEGAIFKYLRETGKERIKLIDEGKIDLCGHPFENLDLKSPERQVGQISAKSIPEASTWYLAFNTSKGLTNDPQFRRALSLSLDTPQLLRDHLFSGFPARNLIPPSIALLSSGEPNPKEQNFFEELQDAKTLLQEVLTKHKMTARDVNLDFFYIPNTMNTLRAEAMARMWHEHLEINVQAKPCEIKWLNQANIRDNADIILAYWVADYPDPLNFLGQFSTLDTPDNLANFNDDSYNDLIDKLKKTSLTQERGALAAEAERMLLDDHVLLPIVHKSSLTLVSKGLKDAYFSPMGHLDLRWARLEPR